MRDLLLCRRSSDAVYLSSRRYESLQKLLVYSYGHPSDIGRFQAIFGLSIVDLRINETLQIGAVGNSAYQTWGAKVSIYFLNSP